MHEGHRERMKQRFLNEGLDHFSQHQVLELLLFYTIPRRDTNPLAHKLVKRYGSLVGVLEAGYEDLMTVKGVTRNTAIFLSMIPHLCRRYLNEKQGEKPQLNSSAKAGEYVKSLFHGRVYEVFYVICLDSQTGSIMQPWFMKEPLILPRSTPIDSGNSAQAQSCCHNTCP